VDIAHSIAVSIDSEFFSAPWPLQKYSPKKLRRLVGVLRRLVGVLRRFKISNFHSHTQTFHFQGYQLDQLEHGVEK
jgi:hypothetical protein